MTATQSTIERKLTTILAADAAGYSSAMDADEVGTLEALRAAREVFSKFITRHNGRIANTAGDGLIAEFPSVVEAVQCAIEVQRELGDNGHGGSLRFRIGIHLGDVIVDGDDLLGEGVNLAARLQTMADPGGVLVSQQVYDQVHSKLTVGFEYLGERRPKNFSEDVSVYCVSFADDKHKGFFGRNAKEPRHPADKQTPKRPERPQSVAADTGNVTDIEALREKVIRHAKILGAVWIGLLAINLATSGIFWAQWPGIAMLVLIGLEAAPHFSSSRYGAYLARFAVIVGALVLINLLTWTGTLWVVWPAGALIVAEVIRRISAKRS
ncbi:MAG: adenylate/guanylate cyclase domain-containing protein [Hyphomicrobiales bacterium]|nr:adenylate/guanylate cyclase domain-containing protein [Hyphomicrobiales bacterium]